MASDGLIALCAEHGCNSLYGQSLSSVLDSAQGMIAGLISQVKRDGMAHAVSAVLGGHGGAVCEAEIFASLINDGDQERIGLLLQVQGVSTSDTLAADIQALMALPYTQPLGSLLKQVQTLAERHAVMEVLRSTGANMSVSAKLLGISSPDLAARLARLGLDRAQYTAH
jgi:DNA-binding NtrC family response regulator